MLGASAPLPPNPFQTPLRSGFPSDKRGSGPAGPLRAAPRPKPLALPSAGGAPLSCALVTAKDKTAAAMAEIHTKFFLTLISCPGGGMKKLFAQVGNLRHVIDS